MPDREVEYSYLPSAVATFDLNQRDRRSCWGVAASGTFGLIRRDEVASEFWRNPALPGLHRTVPADRREATAGPPRLDLW